MTYDIRQARMDDLPLLADIERAAGALFATAGIGEVNVDDVAELRFVESVARTAGAFVAATDDKPVGFILSAPLDLHIHIYELSVHPAHGRQGLGRKLIEQVCDDAAARGFAAVTLSTFSDVPWNAPFYATCGFRLLNPAEWTPAFYLAHYHEKEMGLPIERRCFMRKELK
ncbi:MAG: GNAT family N-acetyltransferase [Parvibaculum sp.]|uniref:GNAT family N-acetyltransferase n=1 Tax=Parvibaculum sp. TaxID=2024848 RepID=UPI0027189B8E|nr:GNAT family N-acetyltransferase [Parvibaculum sp.]MDO8840524.1 GNAT family N-acetyltransferase [Parvibaculum sp.]